MNSLIKPFWHFSILVAFVGLTYAPFFFLGNKETLPLIRENGPYQSVTAIAFLLAAIFLILAYFRQSNGNQFGNVKTKRNIFIIGLAVVLFIGAGEEASWGQHMFGFEPPAAIAEHNRQGELNIHNLYAFSGRDKEGVPKSGLYRWLTVSRLFSVFWLVYCVCVPLLVVASSSASAFIGRINMPVVPLWIGLAFPINYLFSKVVTRLTDATGHYVVEVKETNFSIMFFLFAVSVYFAFPKEHRIR